MGNITTSVALLQYQRRPREEDTISASKVWVDSAYRAGRAVIHLVTSLEEDIRTAQAGVHEVR